MSYLDEQKRKLDKAMRLREERISRAESRIVPMEEYRPADWLTENSAARWAGKEVKPRQWLLESWMPFRQTTAIYGDGGTGKSLIAQQLCTCVAIGKQFMELPTKIGPVLGWFCEDDDEELHRRQLSINAWARVGMENLGNFYPISRIGMDNALIRFDAGGIGAQTEVWYELRDQVGDTKPALLVVDTAADTFAGNENDRQQVRQYIQRCLTSLAVEFDCAVLLCAHPSKSGIASGSGDGGNTAWNNSVRSRMYLERPKADGDEPQDTDERILTRKKANYAAMGEEMRLYWAQGVFWQKQSATAKRTAEERARDLFIELLDTFSRRRIEVSGKANSSTYAPSVFAAEPKAKDERVRKSELEAAMYWLIDRGEVQIEEQGTPSRPRSVVVRSSVKPNHEW